jgi:AAA domain
MPDSAFSHEALIVRPPIGQPFGAVRIFTAAELMAEELPPIRWVVPGILPEGVTFLAGRPKLGKSWMVLGLGLAVATGGVALGTKRVEQGEVLYLSLEDPKRRIHNRLGKLLVDEPAPPNLHIVTEWPRLDEGGAELLDDWVAIHPNARLVIVDTLAMFKPHASGKRSAYDEDREAVGPLAPIAADHNVSILLVHHLREAESDDPLDMIHGSAGLTGGVDGALVLKRRRGQADAYLHVDGRDIENPTELALKFDPNAATWAVMGDAEEYRLSESRRAIIRVLGHADEPLGPKDIAEMTDAREGATRELLSQMVKDGQVKNLGRGQYVLPDSPQNSPDNADILTNGRGDVSLSGMSGHFREEPSSGISVNEQGEAEF